MVVVALDNGRLAPPPAAHGKISPEQSLPPGDASGCHQVLAELAAEPVKIAKNPGAGKKAGICGEESGAGVLKVPLCGWQPQQHAGVRAGVPQPRRRPLPVTHQPDHPVPAAREASTPQTPVPAPPIPPQGLLPQRAAKGKPRTERVLYSRIVPLVPQLGVEPLDQIADGYGHAHIVAGNCPASPVA